MKPETKDNFEWRCNCGKLLFKSRFVVGIIEVKCPKCKRINYLQNYQSISTNNASFSAVCKLDGAIIGVSGDYKKIFGYGISDLIGRPLTDFIDSNSSSVFNVWIKKLQLFSLEKSGYYYSSVGVVTGDGTKQPLYFIARIQTIGEEDMLSLVAEVDNKNIGPQIEHLLASKYTDTSCADIWEFVVTNTGVVVECNTGNSLDVKPKDAVGRTIFELVDDKKNFPANEIIPSLQRGTNTTRRVSIMKDGKEVSMELIMVTNIIPNQNEPYYYVSFG